MGHLIVVVVAVVAFSKDRMVIQGQVYLVAQELGAAGTEATVILQQTLQREPMEAVAVVQAMQLVEAILFLRSVDLLVVVAAVAMPIIVVSDRMGDLALVAAVVLLMEQDPIQGGLQCLAVVMEQAVAAE